MQRYVRLVRTPRVGCVDFTNPMGRVDLFRHDNRGIVLKLVLKCPVLVAYSIEFRGVAMHAGPSYTSSFELASFGTHTGPPTGWGARRGCAPPAPNRVRMITTKKHSSLRSSVVVMVYLSSSS